MAFDGTGNFHRLYSWVVDAANGLLVDANRMDQDTNDIASALSNCVTRDGQSPPASDIPMGGFKLTGLGAGSAPSDAVNFSQVFTSPAFTGVPTAPTPPIGTNTDQLATAKMVTETAFSAALPVQAGNAGKFVTTDGMNASWAAINLHPRSARTANAMLASTDKGALIDITSGTFTQTFDTAANLGSGWYCYIHNSGTGNITIPASDGYTNWIMYPNEARLFLCDGTNFYSLVLQAFRFSSQVSGTWTKPPGYNWFGRRLASGGTGGNGGGGGASGGSVAGGYGGGGGGGGSGGPSGTIVSDLIASFLLPNSVNYTIGAGGVGGAAGYGGQGVASGISNGYSGTNGASGAAGGQSTFGTAGTAYYMATGSAPVITAPSSAQGGQANGQGGSADGSSGTVGSLAGSYLAAITFPSSKGGISSAGSSAGTITSSVGPAGNGGAGGAGTLSPFSASAIAAPPVTTAPTTVGTPGTDGTKPAKAGPACGGAGGSGGSGSCGCGSTTSASTGKGGDGGAGGDGGDGIIEIVGVI